MAASADDDERTLLSYTFGDVTLRVEEDRSGLRDPRGKASASGLAGVGLVSWNSGVLVCRLLDLGILPLPSAQGAMVELGAGCGLPGLLVAARRRKKEETMRRGDAEEPEPGGGGGDEGGGSGTAGSHSRGLH